MTLSNLARACSNWTGDHDAFQTIVGESVSMFGTDPLAETFGVARTTVLRWADGAANPHPYVKKQIVDFVELYARRQMDYAIMSFEAVLSEEAQDRILVTWSDGCLRILSQYRREGESEWLSWQDVGISLDEEEALRLRILLSDWFR